MYVPAAFAETDRARLLDFIEQHSFGLLVSQVEGLPFASHLPFLLDRAAGTHGTLVGHVARANPQWREADGQTALAIFAGPHTYVSPTWYEDEQVVPTWNYTAVHAYGRVRIIEDKDALLDVVRRSVQVYEKAMLRPWVFDGSGTFVERLLGQIVGFRIEIEKIEGKWKLNQNHPVERRRKVIRTLRERGDENSQAVAALMQARLPAEDRGPADRDVRPGVGLDPGGLR
jgi:transcriptional regulator